MPLRLIGVPDHVELTLIDTVKEEAIDAGAADDFVLQRVVQEASSIVSSLTGRRFERALYRETLSGSGQSLLSLSVRPVVQVSGITQDGAALDLGSDEVQVWDPETGAMRRPGGWARGAEYVVTYRAGYFLPGDVVDDANVDVAGTPTNSYTRTAGTWPTHLVARDGSDGLLAPGDIISAGGFGNANDGRKYVKTILSASAFVVDEALVTQPADSSVRSLVFRTLPGIVERATLLLARSLFDGFDRDPTLTRVALGSDQFDFRRDVIEEAKKLLEPFAEPGTDAKGNGFGGIYQMARA